MKYNKLIRDKIPEIIRQNGKISFTHIADDQEYEETLYRKLQEEIDEFTTEPSREEMADILEVIYAICDWMGYNRDELEKLRQDKAAKRGAFTKKIILDRTEEM